MPAAPRPSRPRAQRDPSPGLLSAKRNQNVPGSRGIPPQSGPNPALPHETWWSDDVTLFVYFDQDGTVADKALISFRFPTPTLLKRIKQLIGW